MKIALAPALFALVLAIAAADAAQPFRRAPAPQVEASGGAAQQTGLTGAARTAALTQASKALNAVTTLQGRFTQVNSDGAVSGGTFHLARPGKVRFAYDAPSPLLIVSDGTTISISDRKMRTTDRLPLRSTPLHILLKRDINLEKDARITQVTRVNDQLSITARDRTGEADGQITVLLDARTYQIQRWRVIDGQGLMTDLALQNVKAGGRIDAALFKPPASVDSNVRKGR